MFRARILAQGFTLVAMVAGSMYWEADRKKRKEFDGAVSERKSKEKNAAWIRELEARDEEEKSIRAMREKRRMREQGKGDRLKSSDSTVGNAVSSAVDKVESKTGSDGWFGGPNGDGDSKNAKSMVDEVERRRPGVLELVQSLVNAKK
jgi:hypothetical protein